MIHILQHVPFETPGYIQSWFERHNRAFTLVKVFAGEPLPGAGKTEGLVILGGPMNVYEQRQFHWLRKEKEGIGDLAAKGTKVLGICLGAQLLANSLGAVVKRNPALEIGWFPVDVDSDSLPDVYTGIFPHRFQTFHWHGDQFELPIGAIGFARSEGCANQGFLLEDHLLGLQFHPEITVDGVEALLTHCAEDLLSESVFVQGGEEIRSGMKHIPQNHKIMDAVLTAFFNA